MCPWDLGIVLRMRSESALLPHVAYWLSIRDRNESLSFGSNHYSTRVKEIRMLF